MKRSFLTILCMTILLLTGCTQAEQSGKSKLPPKSDITEKNIKDVFAEHGMKAGTCISSMVIDGQAMEKMILEQFNSVTTENAMKPDSILSQEKSRAQGDIVVEFSDETIKLLNWAKANGYAMRGHTLIWYSQTPEWIFHQSFDENLGYVGREEMLSRMETFIKGVFEELDRLDYLDMFYAYDVVNEGIMEDGSIRESNWSDIIGDDYIWYAFYYADKYAPESVDLYYNDYNEQYKAEYVCELAQTLVDEDGRSLIDGIGMQAHFFTSDDLDVYFEEVDKLAETGLKMQLTEVDVGLGKYLYPDVATLDRLKYQGQFYYTLINGLFERADAGKINMDAITFWGFTDAASWRSEYTAQLFDDELLPKYAYYGAMQIKEYAGY